MAKADLEAVNQASTVVLAVYTRHSRLKIQDRSLNKLVSDRKVKDIVSLFEKACDLNLVRNAQGQAIARDRANYGSNMMTFNDKGLPIILALPETAYKKIVKALPANWMNVEDYFAALMSDFTYENAGNAQPLQLMNYDSRDFVRRMLDFYAESKSGFDTPLWLLVEQLENMIGAKDNDRLARHQFLDSAYECMAGCDAIKVIADNLKYFNSQTDIQTGITAKTQQIKNHIYKIRECYPHINDLLKLGYSAQAAIECFIRMQDKLRAQEDAAQRLACAEELFLCAA